MSNKQFSLSHFFPYQLTRLQALVSQSIAQVYQGEFDLSRQQWRVLAILATHAPINAKSIGTLADLEKMPTSRAIKGLLAQQLIIRVNSQTDKRAQLLSLSAQGDVLFKQLVPLVSQQEEALLSVLSTQEKQCLATVFEKLAKQSEKILLGDEVLIKDKEIK
ncbi:MarR family winged helix-turn-helix transcriptional regulator [Thalassotalea hakodatensis]|uniref:MarR family winged helix-turn-helix transcriptional regulator n=1 Tax=Thalassotalea hakodatensis TaxID=3030492 RepID=UPI002572E446|nr:MarR family transcriptional regulator [Thalassotalea hakodatensis]